MKIIVFLSGAYSAASRRPTAEYNVCWELHAVETPCRLFQRLHWPGKAIARKSTLCPHGSVVLNRKLLLDCLRSFSLELMQSILLFTWQERSHCKRHGLPGTMAVYGASNLHCIVWCCILPPNAFWRQKVRHLLQDSRVCGHSYPFGPDALHICSAVPPNFKVPLSWISSWSWLRNNGRHSAFACVWCLLFDGPNFQRPQFTPFKRLGHRVLRTTIWRLYAPFFSNSSTACEGEFLTAIELLPSIHRRGFFAVWMGQSLNFKKRKLVPSLLLWVLCNSFWEPHEGFSRSFYSKAVSVISPWRRLLD